MPPTASSLPLITIGVTCFNSAGSIERALACAVGQEWPNLEVLVVDDGSTDDSVDRIRDFAREHPSVRFIPHPDNRGFPAALNTIVTEATGEFVAFFDDDDVSTHDRVRAQHERLTAYEAETGASLVFCYSNRTLVKEDGTRTPVGAIGRRPPEPRGEAVIDYLLLLIEDPRYTWGQLGSGTMMARRDTFRQVGPFDEAFRRCAEWDMAIRLATLDGHFIAVDQALHTQHVTVGTHKASTRPLHYAVALRRKYRKYLKSRGVYLASLCMAHARFHYAKEHRWRSRGAVLAACLSAPRTFVPWLRARLRGKNPGSAPASSA